MLYKFSVKNFKGFADWITLDLSDIRNYEFNTHCLSNNVIQKALIYGYNGVGKSNLGLAIFDIIIHITDKNRHLNKYEDYINVQTDNNITEFSYMFKFSDSIICYEYGKISPEEIIYERLTINNKILINYNRKENIPLEINLSGTETLNKDLNQIKISIIKYIKANAVLEKSTDTDIFKQFISFVNTMLLFWSLELKQYQGYDNSVGRMSENIIKRGNFDNFKKFLKTVCTDYNIDYTEINGEISVFFTFPHKNIDFWNNCSSGMKSLTYFYFWLQRIQYDEYPPSFVFIDEFDAFYHQSLSELLVKELIKNNCQVILTTHNTSLMSNDLLRPDCYFLMYKNNIKSLADLTSKELRKAHNIEKMYKAGAFDE